MKFIVAILTLFACSTVFAAPPVAVDDSQSAVKGQAPNLPAPSNAVQGYPMLINGHDGRNVTIPPELLSPPQYQPQPLQQGLPSPLHGLGGDTNN